MQEHEYAILGGINRAKIGRYLTIVAASVSAGVVFLLLTVVDIAQRFGVPANLPPSVLSLVGAGAIFTVLYALFDRYIWRWPPLSRLLMVPCLAGEWHCDGQTLTPEGQPSFKWEGRITITQSWDKIRVRLKTAQSGSNSISAAMLYDAVDGYKLLYHYRNDPNIDEPELKSHSGFAELIFDKDCRSAHGQYFNGHGRFTFGRLHLTRD